jgi:hypothetical protein
LAGLAISDRLSALSFPNRIAEARKGESAETIHRFASEFRAFALSRFHDKFRGSVLV